MRRFEFSEGTSNKFWQIEKSGMSFTVTYGKIGTAGQSQTKYFESFTAATKEHDHLISEKLKKGYAEIMAKTPQSLEGLSDEALKVELKRRADLVAAEEKKAEEAAALEKEKLQAEGDKLIAVKLEAIKKQIKECEELAKKYKTTFKSPINKNGIWFNGDDTEDMDNDYYGESVGWKSSSDNC